MTILRAVAGWIVFRFAIMKKFELAGIDLSPIIGWASEKELRREWLVAATSRVSGELREPRVCESRRKNFQVRGLRVLHHQTRGGTGWSNLYRIDEPSLF